MKKWIVVGILCLGRILNADGDLNFGKSKSIKNEGPWLTGPLIAPIGTAVPYGKFVIKSYVYASRNTGFYDKSWNAVSSEENSYNISTRFLCFFGLTPWCDINIIPQFFFNIASSQKHFNSGDLIVGLDFQLLADDFTSYFPGIKFAVREVFPTGDFQRFSARKLATAQTGAGTFSTQFDLIFYKVFHLSRFHWLSATLSTQYAVNTPVDVHGFNAYGGGFGANGKALPGNSFQAIASFEITLGQNWVFALDSIYKQTNITQFFGNPGINFTGTLADVGKPSSEQLSFAPAVEFNFSSNFGIIAGCWFSALGRNSTEFRSGVVNFDYRY
jgi:hypothetical protein